MIVRRNVHISPVEPAPLSFRVAGGVDTKLDLTYYSATGTLLASDLAAQLQLTGRTSRQTSVYMVPATDILNGRARAVIPADATTDTNGYMLRLVGSFNGEPSLLAMGTVLPVEFVEPVSMAADVIDRVDITLEYGVPASINVKVWHDASGENPYDLASGGTLITARIYDTDSGSLLMPFTVTVIAANEVELTLTQEQVDTLPASCWWSLQASTSAGLTTLCEGDVTISGVPEPLLPVDGYTWNYDYQKPDQGVPASGQVVHGNWTQDSFQIHRFDDDDQDRHATLRLVHEGDEIVIGTNVWTVQFAIEDVEYFSFAVMPVGQAPVTGVTPVTFRRPIIG